MISDEEVDDLERIVEGGSDNEENQVEENDAENQGEQPEGAAEAEDATKVEKKKKRVLNPQPKLNVDTLKGKKGLQALPTHFENVKFKGNGYEEEDLKKILKTYEYWCHRMFPKYSFDDCIAKLENLGKKKSVQVYVNRIRQDLLQPEDEELPRLLNSDDEENRIEDPIDNAETQFDAMQNVDNTSIASATVTLTDDQLELIKKNREKAMQLRQDKLKAAQNKAINTLTHQNLENSQRITNSVPTRDEYPSSDDEMGDNYTSSAEIHNTQHSHVPKANSNQENSEKNAENYAKSDDEQDIAPRKPKTKTTKFLESDDELTNDAISITQEPTKENEEDEDMVMQKPYRKRSKNLIDSDDELTNDAISTTQEPTKENEEDEGMVMHKSNRKRLKNLIDSDDELTNDVILTTLDQTKENEEVEDVIMQKPNRKRSKNLIDSDDETNDSIITTQKSDKSKEADVDSSVNTIKHRNKTRNLILSDDESHDASMNSNQNKTNANNDLSDDEEQTESSYKQKNSRKLVLSSDDESNNDVLINTQDSGKSGDLQKEEEANNEKMKMTISQDVNNFKEYEVTVDDSSNSLSNSQAAVIQSQCVVESVLESNMNSDRNEGNTMDIVELSENIADNNENENSALEKSDTDLANFSLQVDSDCSFTETSDLINKLESSNGNISEETNSTETNKIDAGINPNKVYDEKLCSEMLDEDMDVDEIMQNINTPPEVAVNENAEV